jgi:hypothetical protein
MTIDPQRTDHRPYVETVRAALLLENIQAGTASYNSGRVRSAVMTLLSPDPDFDEPFHPTFASAAYVELRWNEEHGWSLMALHASGKIHLPTLWRAGLGAVAPPDEVACWLAQLVRTPCAASRPAPVRTIRSAAP